MITSCSIALPILVVVLCLSQTTVAQDTDTTKTTEPDYFAWREHFDFNGDGQVDTVRPTFTGGGHCCYRIAVTMGGTNQHHDFPFQVDGGYIVFSLAKPDNFFIKDYDNDGLPEIFMHISTYNGEEQPIPDAFRKEYGISTNRILIHFDGTEVAVTDL